MLQNPERGPLRCEDLQHSSAEMLQVKVPVLQINLDVLQVRVDLQQNSRNLQHNLGSGPPVILPRARVEERGHPGIVNLLQVGADLQQIEPVLLQIRDGGRPALAPAQPRNLPPDLLLREPQEPRVLDQGLEVYRIEPRAKEPWILRTSPGSSDKRRARASSTDMLRMCWSASGTRFKMQAMAWCLRAASPVRGVEGPF